MSNFLIHIHSGPDLKNKLTLGLLVAATAIQKGHNVEVFFAADGVHALNSREGEVVGEGTGDASLHLKTLNDANVKMFVSGMSAKARGYTENLLVGFNASFAMPDKLVECSLKANVVLCY
ncbi:MAG: DsrE family protein [Verrucomicrobia bacterium]|nr:DsrE family protein [Verrucomicrobiota bacterium]